MRVFPAHHGRRSRHDAHGSQYDNAPPDLLAARVGEVSLCSIGLPALGDAGDTAQRPALAGGAARPGRRCTRVLAARRGERSARGARGAPGHRRQATGVQVARRDPAHDILLFNDQRISASTYETRPFDGCGVAFSSSDSRLARGSVCPAYLLPVFVRYGTSTGDDSCSKVNEQMRIPG